MPRADSLDVFLEELTTKLAEGADSEGVRALLETVSGDERKRRLGETAVQLRQEYETDRTALTHTAPVRAPVRPRSRLASWQGFGARAQRPLAVLAFGAACLMAGRFLLVPETGPTVILADASVTRIQSAVIDAVKFTRSAAPPTYLALGTPDPSILETSVQTLMSTAPTRPGATLPVEQWRLVLEPVLDLEQQATRGETIGAGEVARALEESQSRLVFAAKFRNPSDPATWLGHDAAREAHAAADEAAAEAESDAATDAAAETTEAAPADTGGDAE